MAKEQVLRFKPTQRLEEVDDEHCERMQERGHRPRGDVMASGLQVLFGEFAKLIGNGPRRSQRD
jgi:hypothetical protein